MRAIVTRPAHEAREWVERLRGAGIDAVALPLIEIGGAPDPKSLEAAWKRIADFAAVMFVSGNAVRGFFAGRPADVAFSPRAWAPGPGTRDALLQAGVPADRVDVPREDAPQFDSEALWAQVSSQAKAGTRVLVVRGGDGDGEGRGRDWLAQQVAGQGAEVETVVAYVRAAPNWNRDELQQARALAAEGVWLFSSSEAVGNLSRLLPDLDRARARAVATHPRIAQAARDAGFGSVAGTRPAFESVLAALESFE